jgi:hypothetical protein
MGENTASSLLLTVVRSLHFRNDRTDLLCSLTPGQWELLLTLTDEAHITLPVAMRCRGAIPEPVRETLDARLARNARRHVRIVAAHVDIAEAMAAHGAKFLLLKGLTHTGMWSGGTRVRPQYDVDLYCLPDSIQAAAKAAASLGYEPVRREDDATDHLPVMIRRTGWRWRGDYYDPDQPLALEVHFRFWNPGQGVAVHGADRFWNRRRTEVFDGVALPALHPADRLTYAAWHAVRHLLHGSLRICHVYELAHFLHHAAEDREFWSEWRQHGAPADRLAESIALRLAREWFGCRVNPVVEEYIYALPDGVERWFRLFAFSPITAAGRPNKDELFLNLCLAQDSRERCRIAARRIFPTRVPAMLPDAHVPASNVKLRAKRMACRTGFIALRTLHHLRTLVPLVRSGFRWWLSERRRSLEPQETPQ